MSRKFILIALLLVSAIILAQCTPPPAAVEPTTVTAGEPEQAAQTEPTKAPAEPTKAPEPTKPPAEPAKALQPGEINRARTVIFVVDGGRIANPEVWNPYAPSAPLSAGGTQALIEPLFMLNYATGKIEPWLGESMEANETLDVWTLKLRRDAYWSDGEAFNADDVVFSIQLLIDNAPDLLNSPAMKQWVAEVNKVDDFTVEFKLTAPNPRFQLDYFSAKIVAGVNIVPEHIFRGKDPLTFTNFDLAAGWPVFTGAYKLEKTAENETVWVRDDNWWAAKSGFRPLPKPEKLVWTAVVAEESQLSLMRDHQLDALNNISVGAFKSLNAADSKIIAWNDPPVYATYDPCSLEMIVNHTIAPWDDKDMRWMLTHVVNRDQVVAIAYEGAGQASKHFFPYYPALMKYVNLLDEKGVYNQYPIDRMDLDRAEEILTEKGYRKGGDGYWAKDGQQLSLEFSVPEYVDNMRIVQVLVEQFQEFGINAVSKNVASSSWWGEIGNGQFVAAAYIPGCGSVSEPWAGLNKYHIKYLKPVGESGGGNVMRWSGPNAEEYSKLVDQIGVLSLDNPQVEELYVQAMTLWLEDVVSIPVTQNMKIIAFDTTYWTNWPTIHNDYIQPWTWWQQMHEVLTRIEPVQ